MPSVDARPRFVGRCRVNEGKYAFANGVQSGWGSEMGSKYSFTENDKVNVSIDACSMDLIPSLIHLLKFTEYMSGA